MKKLLPTLLLFWGVSSSFLASGQAPGSGAPATEKPDDELKEVPCGTASLTEEYLDAHPDVRDQLEAIASQTRQYIEDAEALDQKANGPLITIPVVVHIVYNTSDQNLSDAVVQSQIDELNLAFRGVLQPGPARATVPGPSLPTPFAARVGDARVQFCLASRDPDGKPTNGITRRDNTNAPNISQLLAERR